METKRFNWKLFFILWIASLLGVVAIIPYSLTLQGPMALAMLPMPLELLLAIQLGQNALLFGIAIALGLLLADRIGLGLPILEGALRKEPVGAQFRKILLPSIGWGVLAGVVIIALDLLMQAILSGDPGALFRQLLAQFSGASGQPPAWQGFLASFYGGINEEILLRLFLLSLLAWLGKFIARDEQGRPKPAVLWTANILAALLFGLGHLPTMALLTTLTPFIVFRTVLLNAVGGVIFGYLYTSRGLESAILGHFSADIVLHVLLAL